MIKTTEDAKNAFINDRENTGIIINVRNVGDIKSVTPQYVLTERDIVSGSLSINRKAVNGSSVELGNVTSAELTFKLNNSDGRWDGKELENKELEVLFTAAGEEVGMGWFTVELAARPLTQVEITASDRLRWLDQLMPQMGDNTSIETWLEYAVKDIIPLESDFDTKVKGRANYEFTVVKCPDLSEVTRRNVLEYCCELLGFNAYVNEDGELCLGWYGGGDEYISTPSKRYDGADVYEQDTIITGVAWSDGTESICYGASDDNPFDISDNPLIQDNNGEYDKVDEAIKNVAARVLLENDNTFRYRGFSCKALPAPYLTPMDTVKYQKGGKEWTSYVMDMTATFNGATDIEAVYQTETQSKYYTPNKTRQAIYSEGKLEDQIREVKSYVDSLDFAESELTQAIAASMGLYHTTKTDANGGMILYMHDGETIAESTLLYRYSTQGIAWKRRDSVDSDTETWETDEGYQYTLDAQGSAILSSVLANKLTADHIDCHSIAMDGTFYSAQYDSEGNLITYVSITELGMTVTAPHYTLDTDGRMTCDNGNIAGFEINYRDDSKIYKITKSSIHLGDWDYENTGTQEEEGDLYVYLDMICDYAPDEDFTANVTFGCGIRGGGSDSWTELVTATVTFKAGKTTSQSVTLHPTSGDSGARYVHNVTCTVNSLSPSAPTQTNPRINGYIAYNKTDIEDANWGLYMGSDGLGLGADGAFYVDESGYAYITRGEIGGLILTENALIGQSSYGTEFLRITGEVDDENGYIWSETLQTKTIGNRSGSTNIKFVTGQATETVSITATSSIDTDANIVTITVKPSLSLNEKTTVTVKIVFQFRYSGYTGRDPQYTGTGNTPRTYTVELQGTDSASFEVRNEWTEVIQENNGYGYPVTKNYSFSYISSVSPSSLKQDIDTDDMQVTGNLYPNTSNGKNYTLGTTAYRWSEIWGDVNPSGSDRNIKTDITPLDDKHIELFDKLQPVAYRFKETPNDGRHTGFIAQDVKAAMDAVGLTDDDFAGYREGEVKALCYNDFIALCVAKIKQLEKRIEELENGKT